VNHAQQLMEENDKKGGEEVKKDTPPLLQIDPKWYV